MSGEAQNVFAYTNGTKSILQSCQWVKVCVVITFHCRIVFRVVLDEGNESLVNNLVPVLLERSALLYDVSPYQAEIKKYVATKFEKKNPPCLRCVRIH